MVKLNGHKCEAQNWFRIKCECGYHTGMWRGDSAGKMSAYGEWNTHIKECKDHEIQNNP